MMKKIFAIMAILILFTGCAQDHYSKLDNGSEVIFTGPNVTYTKDDLYKVLKNLSADDITSDILEKIARQVGDFDQADLEKEADDMIAFYEQLGYLDMLTASYGSLDNFKKVFVKDRIISELNTVYVKEKYDTLVSENSPVKMQIAQFNAEEEARKCIADVNNAVTFDTAAVNNNTTNDPSSQVYLDTDTTLPLEVKQFVNESNALGLSDVIAVSSGASADSEGSVTYYVVNIESRNAEEFKDEFIDVMAAKVDTEEVKEYYISNNAIAFHDQDLYELMSNKYEVLK